MPQGIYTNTVCSEFSSLSFKPLPHQTFALNVILPRKDNYSLIYANVMLDIMIMILMFAKV